MSCHHLLWSTPSVLLRDGSAFPVPPMEEQEPRGSSQGPHAGDVQAGDAPLGPPPHARSASRSLWRRLGNQTPSLHPRWVAGVTKSTLPLIDWILEEKKCSGAAYLISSNRAHGVQCFQRGVQPAPNTGDKATPEQRDHSAKDQPARISNNASFGDPSFKK